MSNKSCNRTVLSKFLVKIKKKRRSPCSKLIFKKVHQAHENQNLRCILIFPYS